MGAAGEPAFENSCSNLGFGFETAGFYKDGFGIVHLVGDITGCTGGAIFTLPAGYRPSTSTRFLVEDGNTDGAAGVVRVDTDGTVNLFVITDPVLNGLTFRP